MRLCFVVFCLFVCVSCCCVCFVFVYCVYGLSLFCVCVFVVWSRFGCFPLVFISCFLLADSVVFVAFVLWSLWFVVCGDLLFVFFYVFWFVRVSLCVFVF